MHSKDSIKKLVGSLCELPGIGEKTATRLALYIINCPQENARQLAQSIIEAREKVRLCRQCFNYTETDLCVICKDPHRDARILCVVETPADLMSIEKSNSFKGTYHVLHGAIAPLDGIGPDQLRIKELIQRINQGSVKEVILATNPTMNGNATAIYISDQVTSAEIRITRIAQGIPAGGDIGYVDQMTLKNALEGRRTMS